MSREPPLTYNAAFRHRQECNGGVRSVVKFLARNPQPSYVHLIEEMYLSGLQPDKLRILKKDIHTSHLF